MRRDASIPSMTTAAVQQPMGRSVSTECSGCPSPTPCRRLRTGPLVNPRPF